MATAATEMASTVAEIARNATQTSQATQQAIGRARQGTREVDHTINAIQQVAGTPGRHPAPGGQPASGHRGGGRGPEPHQADLGRDQPLGPQCRHRGGPPGSPAVALRWWPKVGRSPPAPSRPRTTLRRCWAVCARGQSGGDRHAHGHRAGRLSVTEARRARRAECHRRRGAQGERHDSPGGHRHRGAALRPTISSTTLVTIRGSMRPIASIRKPCSSTAPSWTPWPGSSRSVSPASN